jgi:hypothetical protein
VVCNPVEYESVMLLILRFTQKEQEKEAQKFVLLDQVHAECVELAKEAFSIVSCV